MIVPSFQGLRIHLPNAQVARSIHPCDVMFRHSSHSRGSRSHKGDNLHSHVSSSLSLATPRMPRTTTITTAIHRSHAHLTEAATFRAWHTRLACEQLACFEARSSPFSYTLRLSLILGSSDQGKLHGDRVYETLLRQTTRKCRGPHCTHFTHTKISGDHDCADISRASPSLRPPLA